MFNQITRAMCNYAHNTAEQSVVCAGFVRSTVRNFAATAHHTVLILGVLAIGLLGLIFVKPEIADQLKELSPFAEEYEVDNTAAETPLAPSAIDTVAPAIATPPAAEVRTVQQGATKAGRPQQATATQQKWITHWLAKRYRVAGDAIHMLVSTSYQVAKELKLDPLLILSVIAIESRFNPLSESPVGAQGLMQVMAKIHQDKFQQHGGVAAALNPVTNIKVGASILKDYVTQGGSIEAGLRMYVGAGASSSDSGYGRKVLSEYRYLQEVAMGKKVPAYVTAPRTPPKTVIGNEPAELLPTAIDDLPKHKNSQKNPTDQVAALWSPQAQ